MKRGIIIVRNIAHVRRLCYLVAAALLICAYPVTAWAEESVPGTAVSEYESNNEEGIASVVIAGDGQNSSPAGAEEGLLEPEDPSARFGAPMYQRGPVTFEITKESRSKEYDGKQLMPKFEFKNLPANARPVVIEKYVDGMEPNNEFFGSLPEKFYLTEPREPGKVYNLQEWDLMYFVYPEYYVMVNGTEQRKCPITCGATLEITPRRVTVSPGDYTMVAGSALPSFELVYGDPQKTFVEGNVPEYEYIVEGDTAVPGTYPIKLKLKAFKSFEDEDRFERCYTVTELPGTLTVTAPQPTTAPTDDGHTDSHDYGRLSQSAPREAADAAFVIMDTEVPLTSLPKTGGRPALYIGLGVLAAGIALGIRRVSKSKNSDAE
jgi:hypothetical protein